MNARPCRYSASILALCILVPNDSKLAAQAPNPSCSPCVSEAEVRAWLGGKGYANVHSVQPSGLPGVWVSEILAGGRVIVIGVDAKGRIGLLYSERP